MILLRFPRKMESDESTRQLESVVIMRHNADLLTAESLQFLKGTFWIGSLVCQSFTDVACSRSTIGLNLPSRKTNPRVKSMTADGSRADKNDQIQKTTDCSATNDTLIGSRLQRRTC